MPHIESLISARWIVPVEPEGVVLENYAIAIGNHGRILDILPEDDAVECYSGTPLERFSEHVLVPGFINAHTHSAMSLLRGIADDLPLMEWLQKHIWPLESRWMGERFVRDGTELAIAEMLRGGITCFNDMYFFPEVTAQVARRVGIRAHLGMIVVDFATPWAETPDEYFEKGLALREELLNDPLISLAFAPHAPYTVSDESLIRIRTLSAELDCSIHMHLHETHEEIKESRMRYGMSPIRRMQQLDLLGPHFMAVHMTQLTDEEMDLVAETGTHVVHCPESNLKLASGFCPVAALDERGVNIAIGTDGAASNNDLDLMGEMRMTALLAKALSGRANAIPAHTALRMATLNGARALGLEQDIGSLQPGKSCDVVAIRLSDIETQPLFNPVSDLVYSASRHQVSDVWVQGNRLLKNRELLTVDINETARKAATWRSKLN